VSIVGQTISHYKILEKLGEGGMGVVYKVEDTKLNRTVALKFLSSQTLNAPEAKTRFIAEARAASAFDHPNICSVYEIDEVDDHMFIAMQYVDGESLNEKIARGPLRLQEILNLGMDIARGLQEAHEKNIVHRDIKSANVMVTGKGQGKITDFGLAKLVGGTRVTKTGTMLGTAAYMSPEQVAGETVDHRSDIWSLGVILYEMITGRLPFGGDYEQAVAYQIVNEEAEPITAIRTGVSMELERIVNKCLEKDASNRYQHLDDLLVDFRNVDRAPVAKKSRKTRATFIIPRLIVLAAVVVLAVWRPFNWPGGGQTIENPLAGAIFSKVTNIEGSDAAISPDGKLVAFVSDHDGQFDVWVSQVGTGNVYNRTRGQAGDVRRGLQAVGFSANSSEILLSGSPMDRLQIMPLLAGPLRNVLKDGVIQAAWSPDGSRVVYFAGAPGDPVFVADGDGTNSRKILDSDAGMHQHYLTWSLNGEWIYLTRGRENVWNTDLWRVRADGSESERLTENLRDVTYPTPINERTVLFVARNEDGSGPWLWGLDLETMASNRVSIGLEKYRSLSASQDGRRLAATVIHPEAHLWSVPILDHVAGESDASLYDLPAVNAQEPLFSAKTLYFLSSTGAGNGLWKYDDGQIEEVWNGAKSALFEAPAVSPDGKSVAVVLRRDGKHRIHVLSADGSNLRELAESIDARGTASWSPDGKWIVVGGSDALGPGLFKILVDGDKLERIADGEALNPVWSPREDLIIYTGKQVVAFSALLAVRSDGTKLEFPDIKVRIAGERCRFLPDGSGIIYLKGTVARQDFWLLDLSTMNSRKLSELASGTTTQSFDISPDGKVIVFDRLSDNSEIVLIELADDETSE
jgi:Tol biopolymer transport system component/predicted Ser/Thr protein kinase